MSCFQSGSINSGVLHRPVCGFLLIGFNVTVGEKCPHLIEEKHKNTCSRFQSDKRHSRDSPAEVEAASTSVPPSNNTMVTHGSADSLPVADVTFSRATSQTVSEETSAWTSACRRKDEHEDTSWDHGCRGNGDVMIDGGVTKTLTERY